MMMKNLSLVALVAAIGVASCNGRELENNVKIVNDDVDGVFGKGYYIYYGEEKMKELFKEAYPESDLNKAGTIIYELHQVPMGSALIIEKQAPIVLKFWDLNLENTLWTIKRLTETCGEVVSTEALLAEIASMHGIGSASMEALEESISRGTRRSNID